MFEMMYRKTLIIFLLLVGTDAFANSFTLQVSDDGEPLAMAEVILVNADTRQVVDSQFTDKNGRYVYSKSRGRFNVLVSKTEYANGTINNINLNKGNVVRKMDLVPSAFVENTAAGFGDNSEGCDD